MGHSPQGFADEGLPDKNPSRALTLPLATVLAPFTLSLRDSFSTLPLGFSTVAFTLLHATRHYNIGVRIYNKILKMLDFVQSFGTPFPYSFVFLLKSLDIIMSLPPFQTISKASQFLLPLRVQDTVTLHYLFRGGLVRILHPNCDSQHSGDIVGQLEDTLPKRSTVGRLTGNYAAMFTGSTDLA